MFIHINKNMLIHITHKRYQPYTLLTYSINAMVILLAITATANQYEPVTNVSQHFRSDT